jgi:hypothetical protein
MNNLPVKVVGASGDQRGRRDTAQRLEGPGRFEGGHIAHVDQGLVRLIAIIGQIIAAHLPIGPTADKRHQH